MYDALRAKGIPTALCMFEGEQHGFRQAKNIRRCIGDPLGVGPCACCGGKAASLTGAMASADAEHFFFCRVFGLPATMPADVEPIEIVNLPPSASI
jgi:hypothetical protein